MDLFIYADNKWENLHLLSKSIIIDMFGHAIQ